MHGNGPGRRNVCAQRHDHEKAMQNTLRAVPTPQLKRGFELDDGSAVNSRMFRAMMKTSATAC